MVDYRRALLDLAGSPHVGGYAASSRMARSSSPSSQAELGARLPGPDASREELCAARSGAARTSCSSTTTTSSPGQLENPLGGLVDLLALGRDVGLHVVLARRVGGSARGAYEPFFQRHARAAARPACCSAAIPTRDR